MIGPTKRSRRGAQASTRFSATTRFSTPACRTEIETRPQARPPRGSGAALATHARGTAPGHLADGVRDHYVVPDLTVEEIRGGFDMSNAIKTFIRERCVYRATITPNGGDARAAEDEARRVGLGRYGRPLFNALGGAVDPFGLPDRHRATRRTRLRWHERQRRAPRVPDASQGRAVTLLRRPLIRTRAEMTRGTTTPCVGCSSSPAWRASSHGTTFSNALAANRAGSLTTWRVSRGRHKFASDTASSR